MSDLRERLEALAEKWDSADYAIAEVNNPLLPQEQCAIELRAALAETSEPEEAPSARYVHHSFDGFSPTQDCSCGWKAPQAYRSTVDGAKSQWEKHVLLVTTEYTEREEAAIAEMMKLLDVSRKVILRGALAAYQLQVKGEPSVPPALPPKRVTLDCSKCGGELVKSKYGYTGELYCPKCCPAVAQAEAVPPALVKEGEPRSTSFYLNELNTALSPHRRWEIWSAATDKIVGEIYYSSQRKQHLLAPADETSFTQGGVDELRKLFHAAVAKMNVEAAVPRRRRS